MKSIQYTVTDDVGLTFEFKIVRRVLTYSVCVLDGVVLRGGFNTLLAAKRWAKYWALNYEALDYDKEEGVR
jgi:hypothetical protein